MAKFSEFLRSSILSKVVMAATGLLLVLFVIGHLLGNLQIFLGQDKFNTYAATLQGLGGLLWLVRIGLLAFLALHVISSIRLGSLNRSARPVQYANKKAIQSTIYSRTMLLSGMTLMAFIIFHLLHFTAGKIQPAAYNVHDALGRHDAYTMFVLGFQNPVIALSYIVAMILLGFHLFHAIQSAFQTLGVSNAKYRRIINSVSMIVGGFVAGGNIALVLAVLAGIVKLP